MAMDDAQWIASLKTMTTDQLLDALIELDDNVGGVGDPYYRDLYGAVIERAREIRRPSRRPEPPRRG